MAEGLPIYRRIFDAVTDGLVVVDLERGAVAEANPAACAMHGYDRDGFVGIDVASFVQPADGSFLAQCGRQLAAGRDVEARCLHVRRDGSTFHAEWRGSAFQLRERTCLLAGLRDISQQVQTETALLRREANRVLEQATLLEISRVLSSSPDFRPRLVLDQLSHIIDYSRGALFALQKGAMHALALRGVGKLARSEPVRMSLISPEQMATLSQHQPMLVAELQEDGPQARFLNALLMGRSAELIAGMRSWLWLPMLVKGALVGGVGLAHETSDHFTVHQADLVRGIVNQAAVIMVNAEHHAQALALAVIEERQSMARSLHDAVNQSLFSAGLIAEVLPRLWERDQTAARGALENLRGLTRSAQAEMRSLLAELRPAAITDADLGEMIGLLARAFSSRTGLAVDLDIDGEFLLPADAQLAFYRVCQEALNNIAKHAHADHVDIALRQRGPEVELRVRDDGAGFDPERVLPGHYGLRMMNEHAAVVGAFLTLSSKPGAGAETTLRWQRRAPEEAA